MRMALVVGVCLWVTACGSSELEALRLEVTSLQQQQQAYQGELVALSVQLGKLVVEPQLDFSLSLFETTVSERAFQPVLLTSTQLQVKGDGMPVMFYVDVLMEVEIQEENFHSTVRQVFPVFNGQSHIELQHVLPVHGLNPDQVRVALTPVNWYQGQRIPETAIRYNAF